ncbi:MAG: 50S ribosomal protein L6 [Rickettsiales bacterium]|nr:50S ribosomal protein L6 [Rickettsiales bacterium]
MSRIGRMPIDIPEGVKVTIEDSNVSVTGKLGTLSSNFSSKIDILLEDNVLKLDVKDKDDREIRAFWGLSRSLINNMVEGVSKGFEKRLEITGVGYRASVSGKYLNLALGYSHDIKFEIPEGITVKAVKPTLLSITGCDKQKVGQVAATIIKQRPPEPYKGKGIKLEGAWILRKEGKKK